MKNTEKIYYVRYDFSVIVKPLEQTPSSCQVLLNPPTTNLPTTDYLPTDPPPHRPTNHGPFDTVIIFNRLENSKIFTLQNTNTAGKIGKIFEKSLIYWLP